MMEQKTTLIENPNLETIQKLVEVIRSHAPECNSWLNGYMTGIFASAQAFGAINAEQAAVLHAEKDQFYSRLKQPNHNCSDHGCPQNFPVSQIETNQNVGSL